MDFRPAPRWMRYRTGEYNGNDELGVAVEQLPPHELRQAVLPDGALLTTFHEISFRVAWDVPRSTKGTAQGAEAR